ncbi:MAG: hypothetical protein ACR2IP_14245 [Solirubrobacteraceae bacterium]
MRRLARRSGATDAELALLLPGDDLVGDPVLVMDRAATFDVPPEVLWPWLVQLGKHRGGWYFPRLMAPLTARVAGMAGAVEVERRWQQLAVGDEVPDYGPGEPVFRAQIVSPPQTLVWLTRRDPAAGHRWPSSPDTPALVLSWGLYLTALPGGRTRLQLRVRARPARPWRIPGLMGVLAGMADWVTVVALFRGLRERLA